MAVGDMREILEQTKTLVELVRLIGTNYGKGGQDSTVCSGIRRLDALVHGFAAGELSVILASEVHEARALALTFLRYWAFDCRHRVVICSPWGSREEIIDRLVANQAKIALRKMKLGLMDETHFQKMVEALSEIEEDSLELIQPAKGESFGAVVEKAVDAALNGRVEVVIIESSSQHLDLRSIDRLRKSVRHCLVPVLLFFAAGSALKSARGAAKQAKLVVEVRPRANDTGVLRKLDLYQEENLPLGQVQLSYDSEILCFEEEGRNDKD